MATEISRIFHSIHAAIDECETKWNEERPEDALRNMREVHQAIAKLLEAMVNVLLGAAKA